MCFELRFSDCLIRMDFNVHKYLREVKTTGLMIVCGEHSFKAMQMFTLPNKNDLFL